MSKNQFISAEFIFITLGQTEAWIDRNENFTWGAAPVLCKDFYFGRENYKIKNFSLEEIITDLSYVIQAIQGQNQTVKIFLTLSPVPSSATFFDKNVILSSATGKAKLRLAIESVMENFRDIYYVPSYENVLLDNENFKVDKRHVKKSKVKDIFEVFNTFEIS